MKKHNPPHNAWPVRIEKFLGLPELQLGLVMKGLTQFCIGKVLVFQP